MIIKNMFAEDIDRKINGVVKVEQDESAILVQELDEYVITKELKKHFIDFFRNYGASFEENVSDIGVWISGFFGSGKSHFLKMLSYLLENKEVQGVRTVERFRKKFEDDPAAFLPIERVTRGETHTILFNIDVQSSGHKNETAVLRVFAKMFYHYLGYYGEDLKVAKLEQFIEKQGKTAAFRQAFEEKNGASWLDARDSFVFYEDDVVSTLMDILGMSRGAAENWFNGTETVELSIAKLVSEIKEHVEAQPSDYRLLFMMDEVGQYVGDDRSLLLNLQSLVETIGAECHGKVWVVCTGQEAIDEVIKTRENEFSRIQARFKTRLSLSSASADEVIQKRILRKTPTAQETLETLYRQNDSVLKNIFSFTEAVQDIRGYADAAEFARTFPFVPYQFILMQKVFAEIRKHGNSGKHLSGGERSMLSGFQEAAQRIEDRSENTLAPFHLFYDTVHTFLDSSIRRVIERAERAAEAGHGLEIQDAAILKLLYLVRYVDDVKANLDNLVILMADQINLDKIAMREQIAASLERLLTQNYIGRAGDVYSFLTDEEQDIQRDIYRNTAVDTASIVSKIGSILFGDIYTARKYRYDGRYDFPIDTMVDRVAVGTPTGGMKLRVLTVATDAADKSDLQLIAESVGQAVIVLADTPYYQTLENVMKVQKYVRQKNMTQLPPSVQNIIRTHQEEARKHETEARAELIRAIENAAFYVDGEHLPLKTGDAKDRINQALEYLVAHVYSDLPLIRRNADSEADIAAILSGTEQTLFDMSANSDAAARVEEYLEIQHVKKLRTSMLDIQSRYKGIPYGWKELDIACVVAQLIHDQKVTVKYGGSTIQPNDPKLPPMLHKKSEIGSTIVAKRQTVSRTKIREVRDLLRDYFDVMDVPEDEDGLIRYITERFAGEKERYETLLARYTGHKYPDKLLVASAAETMRELLSHAKDNTALIDFVIKKQDNLCDLKENVQNAASFFQNQKPLFDEAVRYEEALQHDLDYIAKDPEAEQALNTIRLIIRIPDSGRFHYERLPELNDLLARVHARHDAMLEKKRQELGHIIEDCLEEIRAKATDEIKAQTILQQEEAYFARKKEYIAGLEGLTIMDGQMPNLWLRKDEAISRIEDLQRETAAQDEEQTPSDTADKKPKKIIKTVLRLQLFPARTVTTEADIDDYVEHIRRRMKKTLEGCDGIRLD